MFRVIIESPFGGDISRNIQYARECVRHSVLREEAPIASHLLYTQPGILKDEILAERQLGITAGHAWIRVAELVAIYTDYGISPGMQKGIDEAGRCGIPIEYRSVSDVH